MTTLSEPKQSDKCWHAHAFWALCVLCVIAAIGGTALGWLFHAQSTDAADLVVNKEVTAKKIAAMDVEREVLKVQFANIASQLTRIENKLDREKVSRALPPEPGDSRVAK